VDELLVRIAKAIMTIRDRRAFLCTNSEGGSHSGFNWLACTLDQATRSSVANFIEDENGAGPGPYKGNTRDDDEKKTKAMAEKTRRSATTAVKTKKRRKAKVTRVMAAAAKKGAPRMAMRWMAMSIEMPMPGITDLPLHRNRAAQPRRATAPRNRSVHPHLANAPI
jgi:hypothetical protein